MADERHDIETLADVERLVADFYGKAMTDPVIGFIFTDVAHLDLEAHLPRIAAFWETVLLGAKSYSGTPFAVHVPLHERVELQAGHFQRWLGLWFATVDELFAGPVADAAKVHALRVAQAFHQRLQSFPSPHAQAPAEEFGGLAVRRY
ncbi:MAG TPA: group III truncated hemoglobin [Solirubrobacteraceae bacterium]|nr:group III truncated hemoglobin [Solirubrobacteraceae bacterium]